MEKMSTSIEPVLPRTANLLACKQWWRVCFLYGDQQKYYRQVYSKAAAQRLALSNKTTKKAESEAPTPLFQQSSATLSSKRTKKFLKSLRSIGDNDDFNNNRSKSSNDSTKNVNNNVSSNANNNVSNKSSNKNQNQSQKNEEVTNNAAKVTILDDPFLFGIIDEETDISPLQIHEATEQYIKTYFDGSSVIESNTQLPELPPKSATLDRRCINSKMQQNHDLQISENDLKFLNLTLRKRQKGGKEANSDSKNFTSIDDISFTFNENDDCENSSE